MTDNSQDFTIPDCLNWTPRDFALLQSRIRSAQGLAEDLRVREENLKAVASLCAELEIPCWLQGKTLKGLVREGALPADDHDDDVGVPEAFREQVCRQLYPRLKQRGFQAVRQEPEMLSILRNGRYIDICFFRQQAGLAGYGAKWFPAEHFQHLESFCWAGETFNIPGRVEALLQIMYPPGAPSSPLIAKEKRRGPLKKLKRKVKNLRRWLRTALFTKTVIRQLPQEEFLALKIEADSSINWLLRKPHLDILTDDGRWRRMSEIIDYLGKENRVERIRQQQIVETPLTGEFAEPLNLNENFWQKGNNFFFYGVYYGFRNGVVPYEEVNEYIRAEKTPMLYSARYYESLEVMSDAEIQALLEHSPLECAEGAIIHGKHRACAMIGRLLSGRGYLPFSIREQVPRFPLRFGAKLSSPGEPSRR